MSILKKSQIFRRESEKVLVSESQFFNNYDYAEDSDSGPGMSVFHQMIDGKIKSIKEWRNKNKKKQKENQEKIKATKLIKNHT